MGHSSGPASLASGRAVTSRRSASLSPVGSKGSKPRKPQHSQHLPKAGTKTDNQRLMHEEHEAILDTLGLGNAGQGHPDRTSG